MEEVLSCIVLFKILTGYFEQMPFKSRCNRMKIPHFFYFHTATTLKITILRGLQVYFFSTEVKKNITCFCNSKLTKDVSST